MFDLKSLPREPVEAAKEIVVALLEIVPKEAKPVDKLHYKTKTQVRLLAHAATVAIKRVDNSTIQSNVLDLIEFSESQHCDSYVEDLHQAMETLFVADFTSHFLDQESVQDFDQAKLEDTEKSEIRDLLAEARRITQNADFLSGRQKRRISYRISDIENELYKEISGFKAFIAAGYDVSKLIKQFGKDAEPLANAIEKARTVTERKVEGYAAIEKEDEPKKLPSPSSD